MNTGPSVDVITDPPSVAGGVRLGYEFDEKLGTTLKNQWVRPPLHLGKTYHEKDWAINLLTSPTAGLLEGDRVEVDCNLAANARAALVSPAACRVHSMIGGQATIRQTYKVGENAVLDVWPAPIILQKAAKLKQITRLDIAESSTVLLTEIVTPGRANFGEKFEFESWSSKLSIYRLGTLIAYENFQVNPKGGDAADWQLRFPDGPYASIYFLTEKSVAELVEPLNEFSTDNAAIGASPLRIGGLGVKVLAKDGIALRKSILSIREAIIAHSDQIFPNTLKRAQTFFY